MENKSGIHTMTGDILEARKVEFVIDGLRAWIQQTELDRDLVQVITKELGEKFKLIDTEIEEILAP